MRTWILLAAVLVAAGCDKKVDTDGLEKTIAERTDLGGTPTRVDCPNDIEAEKGAIFVCYVQLDGKDEYPLEVTIESVAGSSVSITTRWAKKPAQVRL